MDTKKYAVFVKTVELSSLTKAAEELGLTQSGVSHIIAALESDLGLTLLRRTRTGAHLTADGERLLPIIREIVRQDERLHREAAELTDLVAGPIRLGTFTSVATHWLPAMMMQFEQEHPQVEFRLFNGDYHDVDQWLADGSVELGFVTLPTELTERMYIKARELGLTKSGLVALAIQNLFNAEEIRLHQQKQ